MIKGFIVPIFLLIINKYTYKNYICQPKKDDDSTHDHFDIVEKNYYICVYNKINTMYKFKSDLLNEELSKHNLSICKDTNTNKSFEMLNNIEGKSVMVRVFPLLRKTYR